MKKAAVFVLALLCVAAFIHFGLPALRELKKGNDSGASSLSLEFNVSSQRPVTVDISVESMCKNMITNETFPACSREACDTTCRKEGCRFFGLYYMSSEYRDNRCYCNCYEESKIKTALSQKKP